jgi:hypothetical protein
MELIDSGVISVSTALKIFTRRKAVKVINGFGNGVGISKLVSSNLNFTPCRVIRVELIFDDL